MPSMEIDTSELLELGKDMRAFAAQVGPAANRATRDTVEYGFALAQTSVAQDTGALYESIGRDTSGAGKNQARRIYATDDAAMANEYGTAHQPPHPFLMIYHERLGAVLEAAMGEELEKLKL